MNEVRKFKEELQKLCIGFHYPKVVSIPKTRAVKLFRVLFSARYPDNLDNMLLYGDDNTLRFLGDCIRGNYQMAIMTDDEVLEKYGGGSTLYGVTLMVREDEEDTSLRVERLD